MQLLSLSTVCAVVATMQIWFLYTVLVAMQFISMCALPQQCYPCWFGSYVLYWWLSNSVQCVGTHAGLALVQASCKLCSGPAAAGPPLFSQPQLGTCAVAQKMCSKCTLICLCSISCATTWLQSASPSQHSPKAIAGCVRRALAHSVECMHKLAAILPWWCVAGLQARQTSMRSVRKRPRDLASFTSSLSAASAQQQQYQPGPALHPANPCDVAVLPIYCIVWLHQGFSPQAPWHLQVANPTSRQCLLGSRLSQCGIGGDIQAGYFGYSVQQQRYKHSHLLHLQLAVVGHQVGVVLQLHTRHMMWHTWQYT